MGAPGWATRGWGGEDWVRVSDRWTASGDPSGCGKDFLRALGLPGNPTWERGKLIVRFPPLVVVVSEGNTLGRAARSFAGSRQSSRSISGSHHALLLVPK